jgi:tripeptide aminopeptidase
MRQIAGDGRNASGEREFTRSETRQEFRWSAESLGDFRYGGYELICRSPYGTNSRKCTGGASGTQKSASHAEAESSCRRHSAASLEKISKGWKNAFEKAARGLRNDSGECGSVDFVTESDYRAFKLKQSESVVKRFLKAAPLAGRKAYTQVINAGLDANILIEKGIPTITFDAGNHHAHDLNEYVHIPRYLQACELAIALAIAE